MLVMKPMLVATKVMKPLTKERGKKGKVVGRTLLMLFSLRRRANDSMWHTSPLQAQRVHSH